MLDYVALVTWYLREVDSAPGHEMTNKSIIRTYPSENESTSTTCFVVDHNLITRYINEDGLSLAQALLEHTRKSCGKGKKKETLVVNSM